MPRISLAAATADVAGRDPVLAKLVAAVGPISYPARDTGGPFAALTRAIVFQQLAGRAAQAILGRVVEAVGGTLSAEAMAAASDETLRGAGLSGNKLKSLRDLSTQVLDGTLDFATLNRLDDDTVKVRLTAVRGIGSWTAEMFLMFQLRRLDIWPVDDLGVRQGFGLVWGIDPTPMAKELIPLGEPFHPYRSIVARYCWEAVGLYKGTDPRLR
jgi:DNA-3-methyladenine glycosylase II